MGTSVAITTHGAVGGPGEKESEKASYRWLTSNWKEEQELVRW
jgi:hypothetical protein